MCLTVTEFRPLDEDFLALNIVDPEERTDDQRQRFIQSYAPLFGLRNSNSEILKIACSEHIRAIIKREREFGEAVYGDISILSWKAFEAVNPYRRSSRELTM
jgi:hypothetical protein